MRTRIKRLAALGLLLALLIGVGGSALGTGGTVCFTAINDTLPELSAETMPTFADGKLYAPASLFYSGGLGIFSSYNSEKRMLSMYSGDKFITFYLDKNYCSYDDIIDYGECAISRGGKYCVPVKLICTYFGLSWSYTEGLEYGSLLRICDSSAVLSDARFIEAAESLNLFAQRYDSYTKGGEVQGVTDVPTPVDPVEPTVDPEDVGVRLTVDGITAGTPALLDTMAAYGIKAAFFVTDSDVREHDAILRRIAGEGHAVGVLAHGALPEETADLVFEAARVRPLLLRGAQELADVSGWIVWDGAVDAELDLVRERLLQAEAGDMLCFALDAEQEDAQLIVEFIGENDYSVAAVTETVAAPDYGKDEQNDS